VEQSAIYDKELTILQIISLGLCCVTVSILERFRTPAWRPYRAGMFVLLGLSAVFPVLHGVELYGIAAMRDRIGLTWLVLQGFLYILGAGLYAVSG
jgi:adiponectin receptor